MNAAIFVKPMTWANQLRFYVGHQPSSPEADPGSRLGGYFICVNSLSSAQAIARGEARRLGVPVIECAHFVGYARA